MAGDEDEAGVPPYLLPRGGGDIPENRWYLSADLNVVYYSSKSNYFFYVTTYVKNIEEAQKDGKEAVGYLVDCKGNKVAKFLFTRQIVNVMEERIYKYSWILIEILKSGGKPDNDGDADDIGIHIKPGEDGGIDVEVSAELTEFFEEIQTTITIKQSEDEKKIIDAGICARGKIFLDPLYHNAKETIRKDEREAKEVQIRKDFHMTKEWYDKMLELLLREMRDKDAKTDMTTE